jgi:hypothetical protein
MVENLTHNYRSFRALLKLQFFDEVMRIKEMKNHVHPQKVNLVFWRFHVPGELCDGRKLDVGRFIKFREETRI